MGEIKVIDVLGSEHEEAPSYPDRLLVRFPVTSPTWTHTDGSRVTLAQDQGHIDVRVVDGQLEVTGAFALVVELHSANLCRIYFRDSMEPAKGDTP